jgi:toxin-antitoxin system PIN domain toxin
VKAVFLLDVNVLIAMAWPTHGAHERVKEWLGRDANEAWATCPLTQTAFVRILSNPSFSPHALVPSDAVTLLRAYLGHPTHKFWADDLSLVQALEPLTSRLSGHQQVTDAYLLGLAIHKKGKFATMDRAISSLLPEKSRERDFIELI